MFGEVGLGGELRAVSRAAERVKEAQRLGFSAVILPKNSVQRMPQGEDFGIKLVPVNTLGEAFKSIDSL